MNSFEGIGEEGREPSTERREVLVGYYSVYKSSLASGILRDCARSSHVVEPCKKARRGVGFLRTEFYVCLPRGPL